MIWDTRTQRKLPQSECPASTDLEMFLDENPQLEVYAGQQPRPADSVPQPSPPSFVKPTPTECLERLQSPAAESTATTVEATTSAPSAKRLRASAAPFPLADLPDELQSLIVDHMPLRSMARLALTHADWAERVQRSLRRAEPWARSYTRHRSCHDLTEPARSLLAMPDDSWGWQDHLHVLEAVAVRMHPSELVWLIESLVSADWWSHRYFDEEAVGRAAARCMVGRALGGVTAKTVLDLYGVFAMRRNPMGCVVHCCDSGDGQHTEECGGFCADNEMATRAWSLRALTKPLELQLDVAAVKLFLRRSELSAEHAAFFLLNYVGSVWEMWDFDPSDARELAMLATELELDGTTVGALLARLAAEEEAATSSAGGAAADGADADVDAQHAGEAELAPAHRSAGFECTCTLLHAWSEEAHFPARWPKAERRAVLSALALQGQQWPGFKAAATPVVASWAPSLLANQEDGGIRCIPCSP